MLESRGFLVTNWKRPISLEDKVLRDDGWIPVYTSFTTWETYAKNEPLHIYFTHFTATSMKKLPHLLRRIHTQQT
jgi:hypothetical protein